MLILPVSTMTPWAMSHILRILTTTDDFSHNDFQKMRIISQLFMNQLVQREHYFILFYFMFFWCKIASSTWLKAESATHGEATRRDSPDSSRWFLVGTNSWIHASSSQRHCLTLRSSNRAVSPPPPHLCCVMPILVCKGSPHEKAEEEWTVWWEDRAWMRWEGLRAGSQSGRLARRQRIPFPCQSALSLSESDLTFTGWWLQRPGTRQTLSA